MNHLPIITALRIDGEDAIDRAARAARRSRAAGRRADLPPAGASTASSATLASEFTKRDLVTSTPGEVRAVRAVRRAARAPATATSWSSSRASSPRSRMGEALGRRASPRSPIVRAMPARHKDEFAKLRAVDRSVPTMPSGEMVAPMIDSFLRNKPRDVPAQPPERGPVPRPPGRRRGRVDVHRRRRRPDAAATSVALPPVLAEWLRRIVVLAGDDGRGRAHRQPRQGGRGDAARPARGPDRLRPRRRR